MAPSRAATFDMIRPTTSTTARAESGSGRAAQCMRARRFCIAPASSTAIYAHSSCSAAQRNHHARSRAISMSRPETLHGRSRPFYLGFPANPGWGEGLLIASLLKRYATRNDRRISVFARKEICMVLQHDRAFQLHPIVKGDHFRSPLAVLKAALAGNLLDFPFVPIITAGVRPQTKSSTPLIGIAWASIGPSGKCIPGKSIPLPHFLTVFREVKSMCANTRRAAHFCASSP
jgi:hypothetical protein